MALTGLAFVIGGLAGGNASTTGVVAGIICVLAGARLLGDSYIQWKHPE